jgi:hypothetical protein
MSELTHEDRLTEVEQTVADMLSAMTAVSHHAANQVRAKKAKREEERNKQKKE